MEVASISVEEVGSSEATIVVFVEVATIVPKEDGVFAGVCGRVGIS